jgi:predicted metal-dependent TIM-barrel fold hydrolase
LGENEQYDFENAEYYFINEVKDDLGEEYEATLKRLYHVDLSVKQSEFLIMMQEASKIKIRRIQTSDILEVTLHALLTLLNRKLPEPDTIKIVASTLKKLETEYDFLKYANLSETPDNDGLYQLKILREIDIDVPSNRGEAIQKLIMEISKSTDIKTQKLFITNFRKELTPQYLTRLRKIGVKLDQIEKDLQQQVYEILVKKTFDVLIESIGKKTSKSFAVALIDTILDQLRDSHEVLVFVTVDKSQYDAGIQAFHIAPEINHVDEVKLGKAIKEILRKTQDNLGSEAVSFVESLKKNLGDEYLSELENIGVNFHILELRGFM